MIKKHSSLTKQAVRQYWFTIVAANGQTLATSETYTTAAMRDKGIEAVKTAVLKAAGIGKIDAPGWKVSEVKRDRRFAKKPADVFHLEDAKGRIKKH